MKRREAVKRLTQWLTTAAVVDLASCTDSDSPKKPEIPPPVTDSIPAPPPAPDYSAIPDPAQHDLAVLGKEIRPERLIAVFDYEQIRPHVKDDAAVMEYLKYYANETLGCDPEDKAVKAFLEMRCDEFAAVSLQDNNGKQHEVLVLGKPGTLESYVDFYLGYAKEESARFSGQTLPKAVSSAMMHEQTAYHELAHVIDSDSVINTFHDDPIEQMVLKHQLESYADCFAVLMMCKKYGEQGAAVGEWLANAHLEGAFNGSINSRIRKGTEKIYNDAVPYLTHHSIRGALDFVKENDVRNLTPKQIAEKAKEISREKVYEPTQLEDITNRLTQARYKQVLYTQKLLEKKELKRPLTPYEISYFADKRDTPPSEGVGEELIAAMNNPKITDLQQCIDLGLLDPRRDALVADMVKAREAITGTDIRLPRRGGAAQGH